VSQFSNRVLVPVTIGLGAALATILALTQMAIRSRSMIAEPEPVPRTPPVSEHTLLDDIHASTLEKPILRVHVRWPDGSPAPGATVYLEPFSWTGPVGGEQTTDEDGFVRFDHLDRGTYSLRAVIWDENAGKVRRARARGGIGMINSTAFDVELRLAALLPIRGLVVDESGAPVRRAWIEATQDPPPPLSLDWESRVHSDEFGNFEVRVLGGFPTTLRAWAPSGAAFDLVLLQGEPGLCTGVLAGTLDVVVHLPGRR